MRPSSHTKYQYGQVSISNENSSFLLIVTSSDSLRKYRLGTTPGNPRSWRPSAPIGVFCSMNSAKFSLRTVRDSVRCNDNFVSPTSLASSEYVTQCQIIDIYSIYKFRFNAAVYQCSVCFLSAGVHMWRRSTWPAVFQPIPMLSCWTSLSQCNNLKTLLLASINTI